MWRFARELGNRHEAWYSPSLEAQVLRLVFNMEGNRRGQSGPVCVMEVAFNMDDYSEGLGARARSVSVLPDGDSVDWLPAQHHRHP